MPFEKNNTVNIFRHSPADVGARNGNAVIFGILFVMLALMILVALSVGSVHYSLWNVFTVLTAKPLTLLGAHFSQNIDRTAQKIILELRLPRTILALLVGAALSVAGVIFQGLFRNPMAEPYVIGTSSGASLGATIAFVLGLKFTFLQVSAVPALAFAGALLTTVLVYNLARIGRRIPMSALLLVGIAVSAFLSAIISMMMMLHREEMYNIISWSLGGFTSGRWIHVIIILPYFLFGIFITMRYTRELDIMLLGEEKAQQLGVNSNRLQKILIFSASLLVAAAVSVSGTIGFVGLVIPHIVRLLVGPNHRYLLPASALAGANFLLIADTVARTVIIPMELPVGIITAFVGAPFFIYLLKQRRRNMESFG
jgi:iron complex transport system permease protein